MSSDTGEHKRILYGRRHGRPIRAGRRRLLATLLPTLAVDLETIARGPGAAFDPPRDKTWLEIGFGGGEHLAAQARAQPDIGIIGCEPFVNGVAQLLGEIERDRLANIRIFADDARLLLDALPAASIDRCFVLFPDPWPKRRHHRRRLIAPSGLDALSRVLRDGAELRLASDHRGYIRWMLFHTLGQGDFEWLAREPADWRARPPDWPATRYEEKAAARGVDSVYLRFRRRPRENAQARGDGPSCR